MKKLISIGASLMLVVSAFATGNEGVNPIQTGVATFTTAGGLVVTNTFALQFQTAPVALLAPSSTNTFTYTASPTNIVITSGGGTGATNYTVNWTAYIGGTRIEAGAVQNVAGTVTNVMFPNPYAVAPIVVGIGSATNTTAVVGISSITTTNFSIYCTISNTVDWMSIGTVYNPQSPNTGTFPTPNTTVY